MKDPYETVLADLRDKRRQIDAAIAALEGLQPRLKASIPATRRRRPSTDIREGDDRPSDEWLSGLPIAEAALQVLRRQGREMSNIDLVEEVQRGGIVMQSKDNQNTMGALMRRRADQVGDVVKTARGVWGLVEWSSLGNAPDPEVGSLASVTEATRDPLLPHPAPAAEDRSGPAT